MADGQRLGRYQRDPVAFIDDCVTRNELGQPLRLMPHQRDVLRLAFAFDDAGRLAYDTIVWSCLKKSGKTTINAAVTLWWAFCQEPPNELLVVANDLEQAQSRTFRTIVNMLKFNPQLGESADDNRRVIEFSNGTLLTAIANDYAGEAGANQGFQSRDELWAATSEAAHRLWEELTPVPTRRNSIRFISTYAGFENESDILRAVYLQGVGADEHPDGQGERLHPTLPVFGNRTARVFAYWDHEPRMPWQTPEYYAAQRATLRPTAYARLHENRWTTAESTFITPELWDPCVDPNARPLLADQAMTVTVGVDAALKHDTAAVVAVVWDGQRFRLVHHRIWKPTPGQPLDLERTIEAEIRALCERFTVERVVCDPWQMARSIATLRGAALPVEEFPQTPANTTAMGETLWDALRGRNLVLYADDQLRSQALNTVAIEGARGWRIAKEKASKKIDAIVALAMACHAALAGPVGAIGFAPAVYGGTPDAHPSGLPPSWSGELADPEVRRLRGIGEFAPHPGWARVEGT